jgi:peptidoglycan/xylan/chitin deacetylase (PgdA/CDA1 family)
MRRLRASVYFASAAIIGAVLGIAGALSAAPAVADECPGNPDALGTSRVLALEPSTLAHVGLMQYSQTLPLADKEVVLTFDDGPIPRYSIPILDILAAQCVQATYFLVGEMARAYPAVVRRIYEAGHTIGTHTEHHPPRLQKLPIAKVRQEIDEGIADVAAALGDPKELSPFFRIPGLARSDAIEAELAARSLVIFSSDTVADDWHRRLKPSEIVHRAMSRLEARGKGILLLHDIHPVTVAALPELLKSLKEGGFHVVHVVPAAADRIEMAGGLLSGRRKPPNWPDVVAAQATNIINLSAPDAMAFATDYRPWRTVVLADRSASAGYLALAAVAQWSDPPRTSPRAAEPELPAPAIEDVAAALAELAGASKTAAVEPSFSARDLDGPGNTTPAATENIDVRGNAPPTAGDTETHESATPTAAEGGNENATPAAADAAARERAAPVAAGGADAREGAAPVAAGPANAGASASTTAAATAAANAQTHDSAAPATNVEAHDSASPAAAAPN